MKNDCHLGGVKISIPPTVLFSAVSKMDDISKAVTLDAKFADDTVYVIGVTKPELGGSEYLALKEQIGDNVPKVDADSALKTYRAVSKLTDKCLVNSLHTPALGGLAAGFAKVALGGRLGIDIDLKAVPVSEPMTDKEILFSESNSRFIMTISPKNSEAVEAILNEAGVPFAEVGKVTDKQNLNLSGNSKVSIALNDIINNYKSPLDGV
jgi:phosphoribosylformylglycinamidine synthase